MRLYLFIFFSIFFLACSNKRETTTQVSFSTTQSQLILAKDTTQVMRLFLINNPSDSLLLRKKSQAVIPNPNDQTLQHFVKRLYETVIKSEGVGIAAPQVGILKNIIWVQRFDKKEFPFEVYLNPKILEYSEKKQPCPEGCLSIPDQKAVTQNRSFSILIDYDKMDGTHHQERIESFTAVVFQHEIDHLNGILFIDHLEKEIKREEKK